MLFRLVLLSAAVLLLCLATLSYHETPVSFDKDGKTRLVVVNNSSAKIDLSIENWYPVPFESVKWTEEIASMDKVSLEIRLQGRTEYSIRLDDKSFSLFSEPGGVDTLYLKQKGDTLFPEFTGDHAEINDFLQKRSMEFSGSDAVWLPRASVTQSARNEEELFQFNDSLTTLHLNYLWQHDLPEWYVTFEEARLRYIGEGFKLNSIFYRREMMDKQERLPPGYMEKLVSRVAVNNPDLLGEMRYIYFLNDYIHFKGDPLMEMPRPTSTAEWQRRFEYFDSVAISNLSGQVKDVYLTFSFSKRLDKMSHVFKEEWLTRIENEKWRQMLDSLSGREVLPEGSAMPGFYLEDRTGEFIQPGILKNQIVLINFWATWCKPCLKEFPAENELVSKYKEQPVTILNICIDSEKETWLHYLDHYGLKMTNLYANDNWTDILSKKFDINSLPHSVLVGSDGKVIRNKCEGAGEGVGMMIDSLLSAKN